MRFASLLLIGLVACSAPVAPNPVPPAPTTAAPTTVALAPTAQPTMTAQPTATQEPTATPAPTATVQPTATQEPTATPEPFPELAQYTIEGLRAREYGNGAIEIVSLLEERPAFSRYLIAYQSDGLRITGMLNRPRGEGPFPAVILNHGWYPLDVYTTGNGTQRAADYLAERGFLTVASDFRSHAGSDDALNVFRAGHVIDTLNLIPLVQQLPEVQPGPLLMWGHSNGGAITAKAIAVSDQIAAALIYAPAASNIVDDYLFRQERAAFRANQPPGRRTGVLDRIELEFPVTPEQAPELYERLSPLNYAEYVSARTLIIWGDRDEIVPRKWPEDLYLALLAAERPVEFTIYPGQPHSFDVNGNGQYLPQMVEFFRAALEEQ